LAQFVFGKAESIRANDGAIFERDVVGENAVFANHGMCVSEKAVSHLDAGIKHDVGQDRGVRSEPHIGADDGVCADVRVGADLRRGVDHGRG